MTKRYSGNNQTFTFEDRDSGMCIQWSDNQETVFKDRDIAVKVVRWDN